MSVLVDTVIWSQALRRRRDAADDQQVDVLRRMIEQGQVRMVGPIRQELLSGIAHTEQFDRLQVTLAAFPDEPIVTGDYESAARMFNTCRAKGVQGSHTDFLICAVASRLGDAIFTADADFARYAEHLPIKLFDAAGA